MDAGPELDALVAESVMGGLTGELFRPSTDDGMAWHVVERMRENGYAVTVNVYPDAGFNHQPEDKRYWVYVYWERDEGEGMELGQSDSLPHAICLAALKIAGVTV